MLIASYAVHFAVADVQMNVPRIIEAFKSSLAHTHAPTFSTEVAHYML